MSIYSSSGVELYACYSNSGAMLVTAYAKNADVVHPETGRIKVMSYNVGKFNGINEQVEMQSAIISKYTPDIIGMQELGSIILETMSDIGKKMLKDYDIKQFSNHANKVLVATKRIPLHNLLIADYVAQDPLDASEYNETRAYMKADIRVGGKVVTFINTHLCHLTESVKWEQMQELFQIAEQSEYCIITADFNSRAKTTESNDYINMYKQFVDAGYHLANNSQEAGFIGTYSDATEATTVSELQQALDSIIVSKNIDIVDVVFDTTKFNYLNGKAIDHIPVIVELQIR